MSNLRDKVFSFLILFFYLLLYCGLFSDVVFGGMSFVERDIHRYYFPVWEYGQRCLQNGVLPLWNPLNNFGAPFLANVQACVLYPMRLLFFLGDFVWAFNFYIVAHLVLASFFSYLWMEDCGASRPAAVLSGLAYGMSGFILSTINLTITLCSAAYFPLALLFFRRSLQSSRFLWKALVSAALALQYLAGDPAILFATGMVLTFFTGFKTLEFFVAQRKLTLRFARNLVVELGLFVGLVAFQLLLFFQFLLHSTRLELDFENAMRWSLRPVDLVGILIPFASDIIIGFMDYWSRQSWLESCYAGAGVLALAFAARYSEKRHLARYFLLLTLLGMSFSLGKYTWIYPFFHEHFPFLRLVRYPIRFFFLASFGIACLAGLGLDAVLASRQRAVGNLRAASRAVFLVFLSGAIFLFSVFFDSIEGLVSDWLEPALKTALLSSYSAEDLRVFIHAIVANTERTLVFLALVCMGITSAVYLKVRRKTIALFLFFLVLADLTTTDYGEARITREEMIRPTGNVEALLGDTGFFRVLASPETAKYHTFPSAKTFRRIHRDLIDTLAANFNLVFGIHNVIGYDSVYLKSAFEMEAVSRNSPLEGHARWIDWLNVKYVVSPFPKISDQFERVNESRPSNLFHNLSVLPRAFMVKEAVVVGSRKAILNRLASDTFDPQRVIYIEERPPQFSQRWGGVVDVGVSLKSTPTIVEYSPNRVRMKAEVSDKPWLFFSESYYPGWKAWIDGEPVKIYRANTNFRAIYLKPGRHDILWRYDPFLFKIGAGLSIMTILLIMRKLFHDPTTSS